MLVVNGCELNNFGLFKPCGAFIRGRPPMTGELVGSRTVPLFSMSGNSIMNFIGFLLGEYKCEAVNKFGEAHIMGTLHVLCK